MALPWLESLPAFADTTSPSGFPQRFAVLFMGNGVNEDHWGAEGSGADMTLSKTLAPLEPHARNRQNAAVAAGAPVGSVPALPRQRRRPLHRERLPAPVALDRVQLRVDLVQEASSFVVPLGSAGVRHSPFGTGTVGHEAHGVE